MVTVLATATQERLTKVSDALEALRLTDEGETAYVERLIDRASSRIVTYLGRPLALQTYRALVPAYGNTALRLPRYPIVGVSFVMDGSDTTGTALTATDYRVDAQDGHLNRDLGWAWSKQYRAGELTTDPVPGGEERQWLVEFSAGYRLAAGTSTGHYNTATGVTLPADIQDACLELVKERYLARTRSGDVQSESVGEASVTYRDGFRDNVGSLPKTAQDLLDPYRSVI